MEPPADEDSEEQLLVEKYYQSETLHSRPFITADSDIPENLLHLWWASARCIHFSSASFIHPLCGKLSLTALSSTSLSSSIQS